MSATGALHITVWGEGDPAVFVHGSFGQGDETWRKQRPLADEYRLLLVDRRGFGASPGPDAGDWEVDALEIADALPAGAHLVGHSYGGVSCLLAAARRPAAVRSLTVIEPPALGLARGDEVVEEFIRRIATAKREATGADDYRRRFVAAFGFEPPDEPLQAEDIRGATSSWRERPPWDAEIPLDELRAAPFPKFVVRGAWDETPPQAQAVGAHALHRVCDALVSALDARAATFPRAAHNPQLLGAPFNEQLRAFWASSR